MPIHFEDDNSAVFKFGDTLINLLKTDEAHELSAPATEATPEAVIGSSSLLASTTLTQRAMHYSERSPTPQRTDG